MRPMLLLTCALSLTLGGCGLAGPSSGGSGSQVWEFTLRNGNGVAFAKATSAMSGGSNSSEAFVRRWEVLDEASFGCSLSIMFQAQFVGSELRLSTFTKDITHSSCGNTTGVSSPGGASNGSANGSWPSATQAAGMVSLQFTSPAGPSGGVFPWTARRVK